MPTHHRPPPWSAPASVNRSLNCICNRNRQVHSIGMAHVRRAWRTEGKLFGGGRGWINRQRNVVAKGGLQAFNRAILVAAARASTHPDGADHLTVHDDWDAAPVREGIEEHRLTCCTSRVVLQLRIHDGSRLAAPQ